jgi:hypothetical protein
MSGREIPIARGRTTFDAARMASGISPESSLEATLLAHPHVEAGLLWGTPRPGHPEGRVSDHVAAMLEAIAPDDPHRADLRVLAILHDTFKRDVHPELPWSSDNDHAVLARRFAEEYVQDERILTALELHDEPYWIWRSSDRSDQALVELLERVPDPELFAQFVELDAANEGKDLTFLWWFRRVLVAAGRFSVHGTANDPRHQEELVYVKTFATRPEEQAAVALAAAELVAEESASLGLQAEALLSEDGLRVWLLWRWLGSRRDLVELDAQVIRDAFETHPLFAQAKVVEARILRRVTAPRSDTPRP